MLIGLLKFGIELCVLHVAQDNAHFFVIKSSFHSFGALAQTLAYSILGCIISNNKPQ